MNAAHQIGDDTLQRRSQGYVVPESFNHGTSAQRAKWFQRGFDSGQLDRVTRSAVMFRARFDLIESDRRSNPLF
ncbi:hypothetical protein IL60_0212015 [Brucella inopinata BO1]|nr:hypothetical protein IL60_0212015 [Brucella inopinata BO1]KEX98921.1 hypothetical protein IL61_0209565 [Brucella ceti B1/94]